MLAAACLSFFLLMQHFYALPLMSTLTFFTFHPLHVCSRMILSECVLIYLFGEHLIAFNRPPLFVIFPSCLTRPKKIIFYLYSSVFVPEFIIFSYLNIYV